MFVISEAGRCGVNTFFPAIIPWRTGSISAVSLPVWRRHCRWFILLNVLTITAYSSLIALGKSPTTDHWLGIVATLSMLYFSAHIFLLRKRVKLTRSERVTFSVAPPMIWVEYLTLGVAVMANLIAVVVVGDFSDASETKSSFVAGFLVSVFLFLSLGIPLPLVNLVVFRLRGMKTGK